MRAAVLEQAGHPLTIVDDVDIEAPHAGEVRVRIHHCGVCHSDLGLADGEIPPFTPVILGHEAAGVVEEIGDGVTTVAVGDRVVLTPAPSCGHCYWCVRGEWSLCVQGDAISTSTLPDGGTRLQRNGELVWRGVGVAAFAEYATVIEEAAIKVDDDVPLDIACVLGCAVQTGVGAALNTAKVREGDTVLVYGLGGIGLSIVQGAELAAASVIIAVDPVTERREVALRLGATHALDPTTEDVGAAVQRLTFGIGADHAFDAVGNTLLINQALDNVRKGGTVVMVGVPPLGEPLNMPLPPVFVVQSKRLLGCLLGSVNSRHEVPRLLALWKSGRLDLEALITNHRPLDEINGAFEDLRLGRGIRTVIDIAH
jgi:S-(hydroxymethyl)glutathione dehydrogenase/alcohol dehydrogenase